LPLRVFAFPPLPVNTRESEDYQSSPACLHLAKVDSFIMMGAMKRWIVCLLAGCMTLAGLGAVPETSMRASKLEVKKEIVAVIEAQLAAFRKGDAAKAYAYSAARLQAQRSLRTFTTIVRQYYPEIWTNTGAEFGLVRDDGEQAVLNVRVISKEHAATYDYRLVKERAGWRIAAVIPHESRRFEQL
jgi:hypothetical protein